MSERRNRYRTWCVGALALATIAATACSSGFIVKRVTSADQTTEGLRFYRPWPHLVVKSAFPVATSSCFVSGTLAANGQYVELDSVKAALVLASAPPSETDALEARVAADPDDHDRDVVVPAS